MYLIYWYVSPQYFSPHILNATYNLKNTVYRFYTSRALQYLKIHKQ